MRGEICVGAASILSLAATLLMIFVHVGQINTSTVPRGISMIKVNVSSYGQSLHNALTDPIQGLYASNSSAPLQTAAGLRQFYAFGLYSYCGFIDNRQGICTNHTAGQQFKPYDAITSDMAANYTRITEVVVAGTTFQNSHYLGQSSKAAYWMLLLGTICASLALVTGVLKRNLTFFVSTLFSIVGSLLILIGASIWTVLIRRTEAVNNLLIGLPPISVGIVVSSGSGLALTWAAFACMVVSIVPYMISCCTYRG
ncbi:hypothetical protein L208DRAFT_1367821 [Tricholoma matsutake]|nr:hypothetical protein L208DRAFT_1367821 [Tricholoma matsutake 945]